MINQYVGGKSVHAERALDTAITIEALGPSHLMCAREGPPLVLFIVHAY